MKHSPPSPWAARLLPSLTDIMFLLPVAFLLARSEGARDLIEGDTGWHVRAGEWMLANARVPAVDMFSFTQAGQPWFAWEWLWDVMFALLHQRWGMEAVVLGNLLVLCCTSVLLFRLVLRVCPYRLAAAAVTFLAMASSSVHWWARPHLFTWLFTVVALWVLEWHESGERRLLWTLPLLTALWVNIHGGFIVIFLLLACYAAGRIVSALLEPDPASVWRAARRAVPYLVTAAGCLAASLINPYGYRLHQHLLGFLASSETAVFNNVAEWQSISFHHPAARFVEVMIAVALLASFQNARQQRFAQVFLVLGWLHLALTAGRNIPIFAIVSAPAAAQALVEVAGAVARSRIAPRVRTFLDWLAGFEREFAVIDSLPRLYLTSLAGLGLLVLMTYSAAVPPKLQAAFSENRYPVKAVASLPEAAWAGKVFADDEWGDYLIYKLYPKVKVFIDGRFDLYGAKHAQDYLDIMSGKYDWEQRLREHQIDGVLLPAGHALASTIKESRHWVLVYDDGVAIMFRLRAQGNPVDGDPQSSRHTPAGVRNDCGTKRKGG